MAESNGDAVNKGEEPATIVTPKAAEMLPRKSVIQRIRSSVSLLGHLFFRTSKDDFEKKLQHLSKEEAAVHTRLKRRSQNWRKLARALILYCIIIELLILGIAVIATRAPEISWQMRALRVLPVFAFPALASLLYSTCASYYRMRERKDQKALDRLRNERKAKIDELKEMTNYYRTQQLIQQYDSDPAAKAAAASVLASKLGAESGLKISLESLSQDEASPTLNQGKSYDVELVDATGVRRRKTNQKTPSITQGGLTEVPQGQGMNEPMPRNVGIGTWEQGMEADFHTGRAGGGGWIARLAAMLVGEDPSQCYALICGKCHMHNGLARKEDFQYITYYCPHCHTLNGSGQLGESGEGSSGSEISLRDVGRFPGLSNDVLVGQRQGSTYGVGVAPEGGSPGSITADSGRGINTEID